MTKQRKLAAILFVDIEGYTAMMQKDEESASIVLRRFQSCLQDLVNQYGGRVVNFYGDGALCTFEIPIEAVHCAMALQEVYGDTPSVPVRMGIHSGTISYEGDKVFGDSVNIASRIESIGVAGSILISKRVRDEIKNNPDLELASIGQFTLKNVQEPIHVYAISNGGLPVPSKGKGLTTSFSKRKLSWSSIVVLGFLGLLILGFGINLYSGNGIGLFGYELVGSQRSSVSQENRERRVAVMVFENQTMSSDLAVFGTMISDWLTRGLMDMEDVNVVSAANIQNQERLINQGGPFDSTSIGLLVQGRYYLQEDQLIIHANVVDVVTQDVVIAFDPIQGPSSDKMELLNQLTEKVLGYWSVRKQPRYARNPPKYQAYQKLIAAEKIFLEAAEKEKVEDLLIEAYQLDTSFYAPLLKLVVHYQNYNEMDALEDSMIQLIDQMDPPFTKWEKLRFEAIKSGGFNNEERLKAAQLNEKLFLMDPSDEAVNTNASYMYLGLNRPGKAIDLLSQLDPIYLAPDEQYPLREIRYVESYYLLEQYDKICELASNYRHPKMLLTVAAKHLRSLARLDKLDEMDQQYQTYIDRGIVDSKGVARKPIELMHEICRELFLMERKTASEKYKEKFLQMAKNATSDKNYFLGMARYFRQEYDDALVQWEAEKMDASMGGMYFEYLGRLGVLYAKLNRTDQTEQILTTIENSDPRVYASYSEARIYLALGDHDRALSLLQESMNAGAPFYPWGFWRDDPFLRPLFKNATFQEMVRPKG